VCDQRKTKAELIRECQALRERVEELEQIQSSREVGGVSTVKGPETAFVLENMPVMIDAFDEDGNIIVWNRECERVTGYSADEMIGNPRAMELLYPDQAYRSRMMTEWKQRGNDYYNWEWQMTAKDGSTKIVAWSNISDRFCVHGWATWGIGVDVTESKQAFERILSEQQRYETLVETLGDVVFTLDAAGTVTSVNQTVREVLGFSPEEVVGRNFTEWIASKDLRAAQERFQQVLNGKTVCGETVLIDRKGELHDVEFRNTPFPDSSGQKCTLGVFSDISERKKAERRLRRREAMISGILNATTESILLIDRASTIIAANETAARRFGRNVDELIGLKAADFVEQGLVPPAVLETRMQQVARVFDSGIAASSVDERNGIIFRTSFYPILDAQGKVVQVAVFAADITEQKEIEQALKESEARYRGLFQDAAEGILVADTETKQLYYANPAACKMLGYSEEELRKMAVPDIHLKEDWENVISEFEAQARGQKTLATSIRCLRKDGTIMYADINTAGMVIDGRECNVGFFTDVTERRQAETALQASELRYKTLVENVDFAIGLIDKQHNIMAVNNAVCAMLRTTKETLIGKKCYRKFEKRQAVCVHCPGIKAMSARHPAEAFSRGVRDDGTHLDVRIQAFPVCGADGRTEGFVEVVQDITEQLRIRKELDAFREKMVRADRLASLGTLSATFAHELTQPLTFVLLSVQGLLECPEVTDCPTTLKLRLEETLKEISAATSVVDKFRGFARESAKSVVKEMNLNTVAEKVSDFLSKEAEQVRVSIVNRGLKKLPAIYFSEQDLEQLFFALLQNAIQAADGTGDHTVTVSGRRKGRDVELQFADDCGGIAKENLDRIFEPFFSTKTESQGTGLGLCVVEQIVSRAGGKVRVESAPHKGTTFSVTLPIER